MFNFSLTNYTYFKLEALYFILFVIFFYFSALNSKMPSALYRFPRYACVRIRIKLKYECHIIIIIIIIISCGIRKNNILLSHVEHSNFRRCSISFFYLSPISQSIIGVYSSDRCTHTHTHNVRLANFIWFFLPATRRVVPPCWSSAAGRREIEPPERMDAATAEHRPQTRW